MCLLALDDTRTLALAAAGGGAGVRAVQVEHIRLTLG